MGSSGFDKKHPNYDPTTKRVLVNFNNEMDEKNIPNVKTLRPKMYCLKVFNENKAEKNAKGVPKQTVKTSQKGIWI